MNLYKKSFIISVIYGVVCILLFFGFIIYINVAPLETVLGRTLLTLLSFLLLSINTLVVVFAYLLIKKKNIEVKNTFEDNFEKKVFNNLIGFVFLNDNKEIIWISSFIEARFSNKIIGKKINTISNDILKFINAKTPKFRILSDSFHYEIRFDIESRTLSFQDITDLATLEKQYSYEKQIIGELEVDNIQQIISVLSNEELFQLEQHIISVLNKFSTTFNIAFRQYTTGKYLIITNRESLERLIELDFPILEEIKQYKLPRGTSSTISIGFAYESKSSAKMLKLAQEALSYAKTRGGDQVSIIYEDSQPKYYGSNTEKVRINSANIVEIRKMTTALETSLNSPDIESVIICGHSNADLDAVGAALGIYELARHFNKKAYINNVTFDNTTAKYIKANFDADVKSIFIDYKTLTKLVDFKKALLIIVDTPNFEKIESPELEKRINSKNIFIFDNHRTKNLPSGVPLENIYLDTSASSASEIVAEIMQFLSIILRPSLVSIQMLLNGIYLDTQQFLVSTSARTFKAASWLQEQGANAISAAETLKLSELEKVQVASILTNINQIKQGYYLATSENAVSTDVISMAANEILKIKNRKAAFVIAKLSDTKKNATIYKLSARSVSINVQKIAERVGGGGHFSSAAATSDETLKIFQENVKQAIMSESGE